MPLIQQSITAEGAVVDVCIGVSSNREAALKRVGHRVPARAPLRLLVDTGSYATVLPLAVFQSLEVEAIGEAFVGTPSTPRGRPHTTQVYPVSLSFVSGMSLWTAPTIKALAGAGYDLADSYHGILGRDVLRYCTLVYEGREARFQLGY